MGYSPWGLKETDMTKGLTNEFQKIVSYITESLYWTPETNTTL